MNAGIGGFDPQGDARQALAAAVREHGPDILANPRHLSAVLNILLPTAPEEAEMLVAAVRAGTSAQLVRQVATVSPDAAVQSVAGSLAQSGVLDPRASLWAVGAIARAMGLPISEPAVAPPTQGGMAAWSSAPPPPAPPAFTLPSAFPPPPPPPGPPTLPPPTAPLPSPPPPAAPPYGPPAAPSPFLTHNAPGPAGQGALGSQPPGPQWAGAGSPSQPPPPGPPPGSSFPGGPPPWAAPARPTRRRGHPLALIAAAVVIVLIIGYFGVAATAGFFPFKGASPSPVAATTPTPTAAPTATAAPSASASLQASPTAKASASPSASPSSTASPGLSQLSSLLPSYITGDTDNSCSAEPSDAYVAAGETGEELCDLTQNQNVEEDYVLYAGFPTETPATAYFTSLLSSNGMKADQGSCQNLTLVNTTDGSSQYCEDTYTTSSSNGSDFVFTGNPNFELGNSNPVSSLDVCSNVNSVDVIGFTDPTYAAVGLAISCVGSEEDQAVNSDFLAGDFFLGS